MNPGQSAGISRVRIAAGFGEVKVTRRTVVFQNEAGIVWCLALRRRDE